MNNCPGVRGNAVVVGGGAVLFASTLGGGYISLSICHLLQTSNSNDVGEKEFSLLLSIINNCVFLKDFTYS